LTVWRLVIGRVFTALLTLWLVSIIVFAAVEVLPGDVAGRILGRNATPESLAALRLKLNLDAPAIERYWDWFRGVLQGDFGSALTSKRPVSQILADRVVNTLILSGVAFLLYIPLALIPALIQAVRRDRPVDHGLSVVTLLLLSTPDFLLATFLLITFVIFIPVFPAVSVVTAASTLDQWIMALVLPAVTLAVVMAVYAVRMLRDNLIEVLDSDYIRMAELKGMSARRVLLRHALPNSLIPTLNITALNLGYLIGGVVIIERVFAFPGFGGLLVDSVQVLDIPMIEATVLLSAAVYIIANLFADVGAILLNPTEKTLKLSRRPEELIGQMNLTHWFGLWRLSPQSLKIGSVILLFWLIIAVVGAVWTPYGYAQLGAGLPLSGVSWEHPFGIDQLGRDVFSRVLYGTHIVILLALAGTSLGVVVGALIGLVTAYIGGWLDEVVQRFAEAFISIPFLVLALLVIALAGPDLSGDPILIVIVVAFVYTPRIARMARAAALDIITRDFVTIAKLRGESAWSVVRRELLPNTTGTLLVEFSLRAGYAPALVGSLGFLGFGIKPPIPEWGLMISENRALILAQPITVIGPGVALASLIVGLNMFTEGLARILGRTVRLGEQ